MQNDMQTNDLQLVPGDVRQLENADEVSRFFARLGYDVDARIAISDYSALSLGGEEFRQQIHRLERIAEDPADGDIVVYLLEVRFVTAKLRNDIARRFRDRSENALLVLTRDYSELEFVMLQKSEEHSSSKFQPLKLVVRPVALLVNRLNITAESVALRTLKRFTFTEADAAYQWEKLRSAYLTSEWSEEYFNNRALFSDYYLKQRLTDPKLTPAWNEDVRPVGRVAYQHMLAARKTYTGKTEDVIRKGMYEPLFKQLGFAHVAQKPGASAEAKPDYLLYAPGNVATPIAAVLTYVWNRNLDDVDETRDQAGTPLEIPGAMVVSLLEAQVAPWIIVTNGKLWRLYSATTSNKATNYYEVDLEEAIAASDQIAALKYWWLLFRREAFTGFLDDLLKSSADYAKELGERLKDRVFVEIFPQFAQGFMADIRARVAAGVLKADEQPSLEAIFSGTMTFLYRLMFVLYAESLDLLPMHEAHGYREGSLYVIKRELERAGGALLDASRDKLAKAYGPNATTLYQRLAKLFSVIDQGSDELNMPTYNGGLFSPHDENGQFLAAYAIPDRFLALGLDRLARDVDNRTKALVFIDFKSLGVRQLGSIYEGLLEFKLRVAAEKLAVTREKGKEVYQPLSQVKKPLATLDTGEMYLANDKSERKATGSYYTPDYIVKYIVQHTVGPVLDRKFEELRPRLHAAQKNYRESAKLAAARQKSTGKAEQPAVYWNNFAMQQLVDDCLNVRVVDPAMGSGHFLVEVVDYVSNRLISFLNGWSENPVWAFIEQTRQDILGEMERQHVTIDVDRLTRVALLKRAVLKRCVYGVDLNAMAVELAKVSLWLDAFTLGAPLSFLDHHLKHGNSLIGARVHEVQAYIEAREGETADMFSGNEFAGVMLATELMRQVSYLSDNTVEQSRRSADSYSQATKHLAPFKRLLDAYTSRWFGNQPPKKVKTDYVRLFLRDEQTKAWLQDPAAPLDDSLIPASQIAAAAARDAADKRFFHWQLEFPEVFFAPSTPGAQDVQLREGGGFDAVVGNPPYDELSKDALGREVDEQDYLQQTKVFRPTQDSGGRSNWYHFFMLLSLDLSHSGGRTGMIVPMSWMGDSFTYGVRKWILENHMPVIIEAFPQKDDPRRRVFFDAKLPTSVYVAEKNRTDNVIHARVHPGKDILDIPYYKANLANIQAISSENLVLPLVTPQGWELLNKLAISDRIGTLAKVAAEPTSGEIIFNATTWPYMTDDPSYDLILRGSHIQRYELAEVAKQGEPEYLKTEEYLKLSSTDSKAYAHRTDRIVYQEGSAIDAWRRIVSTFLPAGHICGHKICYFTNYKVDKFTLLAVFGSNLINWLVEKLSVTNSLPAYLIGNLPFPKINFTTPPDERASLVAAASSAYAAGDTANALEQARTAIEAGKTDVVHDLLAHLAQRMIDLNKAKQAEVKRFLLWLEGKLAIKPDKDGAAGVDSLPGKSILQNYLGDYQKGENEQPWKEFHYRLYGNRRRFTAQLSAVEGEIEAEYGRSLAALLPIKRDLARTDALIDKIVYRLYGLTDAEIELIERPQYEQALTEAKTDVVADETITDDEAKIDQIAGNVLRAATRFFERVEPKTDEQQLDAELPNWQALPPDAPRFLLTGDYNLRTLPDHMDFSSSVIPYTKAIEVALYKRIFVPFRDSSGYNATDCKNEFLKKFMRGEKELTLGSFGIILKSSEPALRAFINNQFPNAATQILGDTGVVGMLNDQEMVKVRNDAAHDEVLSRADAQRVRAWAFNLLALV